MTNLQDPSDWYIYLSFTIKNNPSCRYTYLYPPPPHTETVSHHQDCEPFLRWGIRTTKPTRLWRLHPGWGGRPKVYILGKLWYFTNLDFPEIRWFPVLNYRLRWGRLRSLKNCLDIHNTWILWDTLEAQTNSTTTTTYNWQHGSLRRLEKYWAQVIGKPHKESRDLMNTKTIKNIWQLIINPYPECFFSHFG